MKLITLMRRNQITGWRRDQRLFGSPDFVFRKEKLVVFVDGCFWHCCPKHGRVPKENAHYWVPKLERNRARDRRVVQYLRRTGWRVLRIWQHELEMGVVIVRRLKRALAKRG